MYLTYNIWRQSSSNPTWIQTQHVVRARTYKEAQSKILRKFRNCGFSNMSLVAALNDVNPNQLC